MKQKTVIGVTGGFGSGKTTVARMFNHGDARLLDADKIGHGFLKPGGEVYRKLIHIFGERIVKQNLIIDRRKLADIVFFDKKALKKLNRTIHPPIIRHIKTLIKKSRKPFVVIDAPLLFETGMENIVDYVIVVKIRRTVQLRRIRGRDFLSKREIEARIRQQIPLGRKVRLADFIIDNNNSIRETRKQVEQIRRLLCQK